LNKIFKCSNLMTGKPPSPIVLVVKSRSQMELVVNLEEIRDFLAPPRIHGYWKATFLILITAYTHGISRDLGPNFIDQALHTGISVKCPCTTKTFAPKLAQLESINLGGSR
jgi:hypothetical protein